MEHKIVKIHLQKQSSPVMILNPFNCYQKGDFYCVAVEENGQKDVYKFPIDHIFRVQEPYDLEDKSI